MTNIESLFLLFFFDVINYSYISNKTRVFLTCTPLLHHHRQNVEGSTKFEKNLLERVRNFAFGLGQVFQRVSENL